MATDLTVYLDDEPGELARLGQVLGEAGVNIEGFCATTSGGGQSEVHVLVEDAAAAFGALERAGIEIAAEEEVAIVAVADRPGELGQMSRKLGDAGVNIRLAYLATGTRLVFAADDFAKAKAALD
jgi:hypothetical protein